MSLRVWLPLTKDLRQQGLDNVTVTNNGAIYSSTGGKLGGVYTFNGSSNYLTVPKGYFGANYSYSLWFYTTSTSATQNLGCCRNSVGDGFAIFLIGGKIRIDGGGTDTATQWTTSYTFSANTWTHLTVTCANGVLKFYINGVYQDTKTITLTSSKWGTIYSIGASQANGSGYGNFLNGKINDVRIYDHCLSPMEVKELAKGLILHYPLNRQGWGQENLIANTDFNGVSKKFTVTSGTEGGFTFTPTETIIANTQYTVSCRLRGNANMNLYKLCTGGNESISWVNRSQLSTTEYRYFSIIFTYPSNKTLNQIYICTRYGTANTSVGDWFEIEPYSLKLEKGSIATPWCPNSSDALATTMGLNSTIEYDCSGFCNNGTRIGTFTWTSDAAKYQVSQIFNGSDNAIQTPNLTTMVTDKNYTVACWTYKTVIGTKNYQTIYGGPSGFELEARSSSSTSPLYRIHNWGGGTTAYNFGEWTHFCFVHTDSDSKLYVNGVLKITGSSANVPSGNYFVGAWNTSTSQNYEGNMSDFRIYATALSADDVKSLYQNSAYIDSSGNVYGAVHTEV